MEMENKSELGNPIDSDAVTIYLIRHGSSKLNEEDRLRGWLDVPLSDIGLKQAEKIGSYFNDIDLSKIYSSDLSRAATTADAVSRVSGIEVEKTPGLRPINFGALQGQPVKQIEPEMLAIQEKWKRDPSVSVKDGESFSDFQSRNLDVLKKIIEAAEPKSHIAIVAHLRNCILFLAYIINGGDLDGDDLDLLSRVTQDVAGISVIKYNKATGEMQVHKQNYTEHLEDSDMESAGWLIEAEHKFSSTQIQLPADKASDLIEIGKSIAEEDIYNDPADPTYGREDEPHITVKFGIHDSDPSGVREAVAGFGVIKARIGKISLFEQEGRPYDVVKAEIDSPDLHRINKLIASKVKNTETHNKYRPHTTIAYVKKGSGAKYTHGTKWAAEAEAKLGGDELSFYTVMFSDKDRVKTPISLGSGVSMESSSGTGEGVILVGTSGFKYKHWFGTFYPESLPGRQCLEFYASKFPTVEASSTFHQMPEPRILTRWRDSVPNGFVFAIRGPKEATHIRHLVGTGRVMSAFMRRVEILGDHLGPVTFQLMESEPFDPRVLEAFAESLPSGFKYSIEFRSEPWYNEACYEILSKHNIASVIVGHSNKGIHTVQTADWSHIRMSGNNPDYKKNKYSNESLMNWRGIISDAKKPAYVYFNNEFKAYAADNAIKLMSLMALKWSPNKNKNRTEDSIPSQKISPDVSAPSSDGAGSDPLRTEGPERSFKDPARDPKGPYQNQAFDEQY